MVSVLFSEPKIPQYRNSRAAATRALAFQCSSASRKFLNPTLLTSKTSSLRVSVLFSEPKIPQFFRRLRVIGRGCVFQCSSASRKFLNAPASRRPSRRCGSFSALQRAENSSIPSQLTRYRAFVGFQCSSASRKFLNRRRLRCLIPRTVLFQCSSASRKFLNFFLSVHFPTRYARFSALQRAENSSMPRRSIRRTITPRFSALQRAENSSMPLPLIAITARRCFSALQRAENSSI